MDTQLLKEALDKLDALHREKKYGDALALVEGLLVQYPHLVALLIKRAKLIQLFDGSDVSKLPGLEAALESLQQAVMLAPEDITSRIELGHYEYAVNDRPSEAIKHFEAAQESAESGLKQALIGLIKCHADTKSLEQAKNLLERAKVFFPDDGAFRDLELELEE